MSSDRGSQRGDDYLSSFAALGFLFLSHSIFNMQFFPLHITKRELLLQQIHLVIFFFFRRCMKTRETEKKRQNYPGVFTWECICKWICVCLWLLQLCMPAFRARHKSSLEMADVGIYAVVCLPVFEFMCALAPHAATVAFCVQQAALLLQLWRSVLLSKVFEACTALNSCTHTPDTHPLMAWTVTGNGWPCTSDGKLVDKLCWEFTPPP